MIIKRLAGIFALLAFIGHAEAHIGTKEKTMQASGQFDVKLTPQPPAPGLEPTGLGRMTIDKQFDGDLVAHSLGEMLAFRTAVSGSAGYVAMERVEGSLNGHKGSFVLQHSGTMNRGASSLVLTVVPDSGAGELMGLTGAMTIELTSGKHYYHFDYFLP